MKKLFFIRHVRYYILAFKLTAWLALHQSMGMGFFPQESDLKYLGKVWSGEA